MHWLFVALGGALGSVARYGLARLFYVEGASHWFPAGTFAANVLGSLLLAAISVGLVDVKLLGADVRLFLGTGMMGGFTTYSTFNCEELKLLGDGHLARAALYIGATLGSCLLGGLLGLALSPVLRGGSHHSGWLRSVLAPQWLALDSRGTPPVLG